MKTMHNSTSQHYRHEAGFSMIELVIAMSLLTVVGMMSFVALESSLNSMALSSAKDLAMTDAREVMAAMTRELELAAKEPITGIDPEVESVEVVDNPAFGSPIEIAFQIPLDTTGENWTRRIRYRYIDEDANKNGLLDSDEETVEDGVLTRRVVRIQEFDDGEVGELPVGGANNISNVEFEIVRNALDVPTRVVITVEAMRVLSGKAGTAARVSLTREVHLMN